MRKKSRTQAKTWEETRTRVVELDYLQTLQAIDLTRGSSTTQAGAKSGIMRSGSHQHDTLTSGETVKRTWWKTKFDRLRAAIGIRDIGVFTYTYEKTSEIVSQPYFSPRQIEKIALVVDEIIPNAFYQGDKYKGTENDWIQYFISTDNGSSWTRISPQHHKDTLSKDGVNLVPKIININSGVPIELRENFLAHIDTGFPVHEVRFRALLSRPVDTQKAEQFSPVLKSYSLLLHPKGGLR